jgi:hypothetical protein
MPEHRKHVTDAGITEITVACIEKNRWLDSWTQKILSVAYCTKRTCDLMCEYRKTLTGACTLRRTYDLMPEHKKHVTVAASQGTVDRCMNT